MSDILDRLYAATKRALDRDRRREPYAEVERRGLARRAERRSFGAALRNANGPALVAEMKRASPSLGVIAADFDPAAIAARYDAAGADAISVLTEADYFLGDLAYLDVARAHARQPILRKDFVSDPYQVAQASAYGADAILLIVAGLDDAQLRDLGDEAARFDLDVLIEVHDEGELERASVLGAPIVGINNRDLRTFRIDLGVTERLLPRIAPATVAISESGIRGAADVARLAAFGARGFLVGESLMRAADPAALVRDLKGLAAT